MHGVLWPRILPCTVHHTQNVVAARLTTGQRSYPRGCDAEVGSIFLHTGTPVGLSNVPSKRKGALVQSDTRFAIKRSPLKSFIQVGLSKNNAIQMPSFSTIQQTSSGAPATGVYVCRALKISGGASAATCTHTVGRGRHTDGGVQTGRSVISPRCRPLHFTARGVSEATPKKKRFLNERDTCIKKFCDTKTADTACDTQDK